MEKDYIFGTHDEEISRLGLQHRVWRPRALDSWRRAGFTVGQTLVDIGCGPGFATLDLAEIVGPSGRVIAIDRSNRFITALQSAIQLRGIDNVSTLELDLNDAELPSLNADGAWCRWVFAFVKNPRDLLQRISTMLKTGGILVVHEYFHYSTWRFSPRSELHEDFVRVVMETWRNEGGEPDIGLSLPVWLKELGFNIVSMKPIIDVISPSSFTWQWPKTFIQSGVRRLVSLGSIDQERAEKILNSFAASEKDPKTLMITPGVLEIIAVR
ncbi:MAG TPA: methyltransferase domain-containing protein [Acidobacteriota bacterium]|nr:methyltransferase domain-containing protein [Acidobacteriota bacterium]